MSLLLTFLFIAVSVSFLCSLMESVLLSISPTFVAMKVKEGRKYALVLQTLKDKIDRPLAAILTFNTIANTVGAAGVGAQVHKLYGDEFVAVSTGLMTLVILISGEIVPKTLGALHWKKLAPFAAYTIRLLIFIAYPFVSLSELLYKTFASENETASITREEVIVTAEMGAVEGSIRPKESSIIKNLLMLDKIKVADIMTPRSVISAYDSNMTIGDMFQKFKTVKFSRIPVFRNSLDHIEGVVHRYKIMEAYSHDHDNLPIGQLMTPIHNIPENISVAAALDQFIKQREHLFVVVDDYGTVSGLVSLEDCIETLLGVEIVDEFDKIPDMRQYALDLWRERKQKQQKLQTVK